MQHWHVLNTKPHKERQVASLLHARRLEYYLPLVRVNPVNPRAARQRAYFPSYIFVHVDFDEVGLSELRWIPGLRRLVEFGGQPAVVPENFIVELKRRLNKIRAAGGLVLDGLRQGDRVRVVSGPFVGYEGVFDARLPGAERVRVLLEMIAEYQHLGPARRGATGRPSPRMVPLELNVGNVAKVR